MRKRFGWVILLIVPILLATTRLTHAQGCSDAGLCSIPELQPTEQSEWANVKRSRFIASAGITHGSGQYGLAVLTPSLSLSSRITDKLGVDLKLTYASLEGQLGSVSGPGDAFATVSWHRNGMTTTGSSWFAGVKVPLGRSDSSAQGEPLPMDYQTTLGTTDLLVGYTLRLDRYSFGIGWQHSLSDENDNRFLASQHPDPRARKYSSTNRFKRSGDLLFRISASWNLLGERFTVTPSLLPILHLEEDSYLSPVNGETSIEGSDGWTLNTNLFGTWHWTHERSVTVSFGAPMVARKARPDGLTREWVIGVQLSQAF